MAEAPRDASVVKQLLERLSDSVEVMLVGGASSFIKWADVPKLLRQHRVKPWQGHFDGKPGRADSLAGANALRLLRQLHQGGNLDAIVLQRDIDKQPERREGLQQARDAVPLDVTVIISTAHPKVEAWAICAFEPTDADGQERLKAARKELGFDPREKSQELDASETGAKRNAKRVLEALVGKGETAFEPLCQSTPVDTLRARGLNNGLAALLSDLDALLSKFPS